MSDIVVGTRVVCESEAPGLAAVNGKSGRVVELFAEGKIARVAWDELFYYEGRAKRQYVSDIGTIVLYEIV